MIDSLKYFQSKPNYKLYLNLRSNIYIYLCKIDEYIFLKYYNWNVESINEYKEKIDFDLLKTIYEYDYKVFKVLLYLYWDLECYLENINNLDYIKNSLIVDNLIMDTELYDFLIIKFWKLWYMMYFWLKSNYEIKKK